MTGPSEAPTTGGAGDRRSGPSTATRRVFLVGCRRSGTTWLTMLLTHRPGVVSVQQNDFFARLATLATWPTERAKYGRTILFAGEGEVGSGLERRPVDTMYSADRFYDKIRPLADDLYDQFAACVDQPVAVVDHAPENVRVWRHIATVFPDAWFVHVVRDPRAVFASYVQAGRTWSSTDVFPSNPVDFAHEWNADVSEGRAIAAATDNYVEVSYEALRQNGAAELLRIRETLGQPSDLATCERVIAACAVNKLQGSAHGPTGFFRRGQAAAWRGELKQSQIRVIDYLCGAQMQELGYDRLFEDSRPPAMVRRRNAREQRVRRFREWVREGKGPLRRVATGVAHAFPRLRNAAWNAFKW